MMVTLTRHYPGFYTAKRGLLSFECRRFPWYKMEGSWQTKWELTTTVLVTSGQGEPPQPCGWTRTYETLRECRDAINATLGGQQQ